MMKDRKFENFLFPKIMIADFVDEGSEQPVIAFQLKFLSL